MLVNGRHIKKIIWELLLVCLGKEFFQKLLLYNLLYKMKCSGQDLLYNMQCVLCNSDNRFSLLAQSHTSYLSTLIITLNSIFCKQIDFVYGLKLLQISLFSLVNYH